MKNLTTLVLGVLSTEHLCVERADVCCATRPARASSAERAQRSVLGRAEQWHTPFDKTSKTRYMMISESTE